MRQVPSVLRIHVDSWWENVRLVVETAAVPTVALDRTGLVIAVNAAAVTHKRALIGQLLRGFETDEHFPAAVRGCFDSGAVEACQADAGSRLDLHPDEVRIVPIRDSNSEVSCAIVSWPNAVELEASPGETELIEPGLLPLFEAIPEGVTLQDSDGAIVYFNPSAGRILGLDSAEFAGRRADDPRWQSVHEDGSPLPADSHPTMLALKSGSPVSETVMGVYNPKREQRVWIKVSAVPLTRRGSDQPSLVAGVFRDISDLVETREALETSQERYRQLIEHSAEGIIVVQDDVVKFVNPAIERILGYTPEEVIGQPFLDFVDSDDRPRISDRYQRLTTESVEPSTEVRVILKNRLGVLAAKQLCRNGLGRSPCHAELPQRYHGA